MLLAVDVGNTNSCIAVFKEKKCLRQWRIATQVRMTSDEFYITLKQLMATEKLLLDDISGMIISTVVPKNLFALTMFAKEFLGKKPLVVGETGVRTGIDVHLEKASEVGADRLVNALAAYDHYKQNTIIIDFGTATTFDIVSEEGAYKGGVIAPGINLSLEALHRAAAKLPDIAIEKPKKTIGTSTIEAMQSGIYWGYVGLIEGIIQKVEEEYNRSMLVIATGGLAGLFAKAVPRITHVEADLTMRGLLKIYELNQSD